MRYNEVYAGDLEGGLDGRLAYGLLQPPTLHGLVLDMRTPAE